MSARAVLADYITGLQHVGHIVDDIDEAVARFRRVYGVGEEAIRRVPEDRNTAAETLFAFVTVGDTEFELIQPVSEQFREILLATPSGGSGINHVAWRVSDIEACVELLEQQGIRPGHVTPDGIVSFADRKLVYLDAGDTEGLLIELIEIGSDRGLTTAPAGQ